MDLIIPCSHPNVWDTRNELEMQKCNCRMVSGTLGQFWNSIWSYELLIQDLRIVHRENIVESGRKMEK